MALSKSDEKNVTPKADRHLAGGIITPAKGRDTKRTHDEMCEDDVTTPNKRQKPASPSSPNITKKKEEDTQEIKQTSSVQATSAPTPTKTNQPRTPKKNYNYLPVDVEKKIPIVVSILDMKDRHVQTYDAQEKVLYFEKMPCCYVLMSDKTMHWAPLDTLDSYLELVYEFAERQQVEDQISRYPAGINDKGVIMKKVDSETKRFLSHEFGFSHIVVDEVRSKSCNYYLALSKTMLTTLSDTIFHNLYQKDDLWSIEQIMAVIDIQDETRVEKALAELVQEGLVSAKDDKLYCWGGMPENK